MLDQISSSKIDKQEFSKVDAILQDFDKKLQHVSVFLTQISTAILQDKDRVKQNQNTDSVNRENMLKQSKAIRNWIINKSNFQNSRSPKGKQNKKVATDLISAPSVFSDESDKNSSRNKGRLLMAPKMQQITEKSIYSDQGQKYYRPRKHKGQNSSLTIPPINLLDKSNKNLITLQISSKSNIMNIKQ